VAAHRIEFVLFDLGGVLIEPGGVGPMRDLSGIGTDEELWARWLSCRWVRRFEAGLCSPDEFAAGVVADWDLELGPDAFLEEFGGWANDPYPGALELVAAVRDDVGVGCLSNTNAVQWHANYEATPITEAFSLRFLSFELGLVKPDREIFETVATRLPVPPDRVLFLDDNAANVTGAEASGLVARHVRGVDEARRALDAEGVIAG
jgi:putative hydrolase of the HAD superfamily